MGITQVNATDLINLTQDKLSGYQNTVDSRQLLSFINEGKDAIWEVLKANNDDFFTTFSQATVPDTDNYFAPLQTGVREYDLPDDFREIRFIECTTSGYEMTKWEYRKPSDPAFREARKGATAGGVVPSGNGLTCLYTFVGDQLVLADYLPTSLTVILWYTAGLADLEYGDILPPILFPFSKAIASFACKAVMLNEDEGKFAAWKQEWKDNVISTSQNSAPRDQSDPIFVQDFEG